MQYMARATEGANVVAVPPVKEGPAGALEVALRSLLVLLLAWLSSLLSLNEELPDRPAGAARCPPLLTTCTRSEAADCQR